MLTIAICIVVVLVAVPVAAFSAECLAALFWKADKPTEGEVVQRGRIAVLVPAHNEEAGICGTLASLTPELGPGDRLVVVADNCTDATADLARRCGAEVLERNDPSRRGKGYALDFGVQALRKDPPDTLIVIDADCEVAPGSLDLLAHSAGELERPIQADYQMRVPREGSSRDRLSAFAFLVKNSVRPRGLLALRLPCQLMGTGMAFPWSVIQSAKLASGNIVEDLTLGLDLAVAGHPPIFQPAAVVRSTFPEEDAVRKTQRTRWEHGHLSTLLHQGPHLLREGIHRFDIMLIALALDLMVPPLAILAILLALANATALIAWVLNPLLPLALALLGIDLLFAVSGIVAWYHFGRATLRFVDILFIPQYVASKLPIYRLFIIAPEKNWIRTKRDDD